MSQPKTKQLLFKITAADCRWDYYRGTGAGGQAKNKTENCVRCTHIASGAVGKCEEGRSKDLNKRKAFERMANTDILQKWIKTEAMRRSGQLAIIEAAVDKDLLQNSVVEVMNDKGKWEKAEDLAITDWDIKNSKE